MAVYPVYSGSVTINGKTYTIGRKSAGGTTFYPTKAIKGRTDSEGSDPSAIALSTSKTYTVRGYATGSSVTHPYLVHDGSNDIGWYTSEVFPPGTHTISYNGNGYTPNNLPSSATVSNGSSYSISTTVPYRYNAALYGYGKNSTTSLNYYPGSTISSVDSNITLYCLWESPWTGLKLNGDTIYPTFYFSGQRRVYSFTPTTTGYYKITAPANDTGANDPDLYLYTSDSYLANAYHVAGTDESITYKLTANVTYYIHIALDSANFTYGSTSPIRLRSVYEVKYNLNGGSGDGFTTQLKEWGINLTLHSGSPTRSGYTFLGWSTNSGATSATYTANGSYSTNASTTLYAVWRPNGYTIQYKPNGGSGSMSNGTKTHGSAYTLKSNSFTAPSSTSNTYTVYLKKNDGTST